MHAHYYCSESATSFTRSGQGERRLPSDASSQLFVSLERPGILTIMFMTASSMLLLRICKCRLARYVWTG